MSRIRIVMVAGAINSGKTAFASRAAKTHGAQVLAFADHLKTLVRNEFGIPASNNLETQQEKMVPLTNRPFVVRSELDISNLGLVHSALSGVLAKEVPQKEKSLHSVNLLSTADSNVFFRGNVTTKHAGLTFRLGQDGTVFVQDPETEGVFQMFWTPRAILVLVATQFRCIDIDKWVRKVAENIENTINHQQHGDLLFVIHDFRQPNEFEFIKTHFIHDPRVKIETVRLMRNFNLTGRPEETALIEFPFDRRIENQTFDLDEFEGTIDSILGKK